MASSAKKPAKIGDDRPPLAEGDLVWLPHGVRGYTAGTVMTTTASSVTVRIGPCLKIPEKVTVPLADEVTTAIGGGAPDLHRVTAEALTDVPEDLVLMYDINEPMIAFALAERFAQGVIYTAVGTILIR